MRPSGRKNDQLRLITIEPNILVNATGSCLIKCGNTHVVCAASLDDNVPKFLRNTGSGWLTAEYGMLPASTQTRNKREISQGKPSGRSQEIQRLIGRSLRSALDLKAMGERQIIIDCDVINADGGTRTAAITGSYVALHLAVREMMRKGILKTNPLHYQVAAISCGIYKGQAVVDLDYPEDSEAEVDANFVLTGNGNMIEVQSTAEKDFFGEAQLLDMLKLAKQAVAELFRIQNAVLLS